MQRQSLAGYASEMADDATEEKESSLQLDFSVTKVVSEIEAVFQIGSDPGEI